ncbi:MAG TPA: hypothetical protein VMR52_07255 [Dehalococcoidia bacterium]|nr:hypothetical protein [Dehalococcoidia bacterium]
MRLEDPGAPQQIARLLAAEVTEAPFRVPNTTTKGEPGEGHPVYKLRLRSREHDREALVLIWPSLSRVDVRLGMSTWTLKQVDVVDLYPGVEVLFRRHSPSAILFVSVEGRIALVT